MNMLKRRFINDLFIFRFIIFLIHVIASFDADANKEIIIINSFNVFTM